MLRELLFLSIATICLSSSIRGVSPDRQDLYKPDSDGNWHCLLEPSIKLLFDQINDDFCDCPDGLDEPGTNACPYNPEAPKYFCANKGFKPGHLESFKLNDGVCDYDVCCDGSDEYRSGQCPNMCSQAQAQYESFIAAKRDENLKGLTVKRNLQSRAAELKKESNLNIAKLALQIKELQEELTNLKDSKISYSSEEKGAINLIVSEEELQNRFGSHKLQISSLQKEVAYLEGILGTMAQNYNPNFNDAAVKQAIHSFQDYHSNRPAKEEVSFEIADIVVKTQNDINLDHRGIFAQAPTLFNMIHYYYDKMIERFPKHEKNTPKLSSKDKQQFQLSKEALHVKSLLESKQREQINEEQKNKKNYGEGDILRAVEGQWYEKSIGDYKYKIGFLNAIYQDNTLVGRYSGMDGNSMQFVGGDRCWNGPQRSATVEMICHQKYDLLSVFEPQKCHYQFKLMSPLVCEEFSEEKTALEFTFDYTKINK